MRDERTPALKFGMPVERQRAITRNALQVLPELIRIAECVRDGFPDPDQAKRVLDGLWNDSEVR